jgi:hypothetical protein
MRKMVLVLIGLLLLAHPVNGWAETQQPRADSTGQQAGSVAATALYVPLKAGLCVLGGGASLFAFLYGGEAAMRTLQRAACTGTWVLTPGIMWGEEPLNFVGEIPIP